MHNAGGYSHEFVGSAGTVGRVRIREFRPEGETPIFVCSQTEENRFGPSPTNYAEQLFEEIAERRSPGAAAAVAEVRQERGGRALDRALPGRALLRRRGVRWPRGLRLPPQARKLRVFWPEWTLLSRAELERMTGHPFE
jgi:hypothetical protein